MRESFDDGQFWDYVFNGVHPDDDPEDVFRFLGPDDFEDLDDRDFLPLADAMPCPECGEVGACGYDLEGRALIHLIGGSDDD